MAEYTDEKGRHSYNEIKLNIDDVKKLNGNGMRTDWRISLMKKFGRFHLEKFKHKIFSIKKEKVKLFYL